MRGLEVSDFNLGLRKDGMLLLIETAYGRSGEKLDVAREVCLGPEALKYALVSLLGNNVEPAVRYRFQPASGLESCMGNLKLMVMKPLSYIAALQWQNKKVVWVQAFSMAPFPAASLSTSAGM